MNRSSASFSSQWSTSFKSLQVYPLETIPCPGAGVRGRFCLGLCLDLVLFFLWVDGFIRVLVVVLFFVTQIAKRPHKFGILVLMLLSRRKSPCLVCLIFVASAIRYTMGALNTGTGKEANFHRKRKFGAAIACCGCGLLLL